MAVYNRCTKCATFNVLKNHSCSKCGANLKGIKNYYIRLTIAGKRLFKPAGSTITGARLLEARLRGSDKEDKPVAEKVLFTEFIEKIFMPHYEAKNKETRRAFSKLRTISNAFQAKIMSEIKPLDIENFFQYQISINSVSTANNYLSYIKRIFNYALEMGYILASPVKTKPVKFDDRRTRRLSTDEKEALLYNCRNSMNKSLYAIVLIAMQTGLRRGEIAAIKSEDIQDGIITVKSSTSKNKRARHIPLTKQLCEILKDINKLKLGGDIKNSFRNACKAAGIKDFRFHDLRHTFASDLVSSGVDLYVVATLLGHSSIEMSKRYAHLAPSSLRKAISIFDKEQGV